MPTEYLAILCVVSFFVLLMIGLPVALTLAVSGLFFGYLGFGAGLFSLLPARIYGVTANYTLIAIPLFVFMGVMLEKSRLAEELMDVIGHLAGSLRGGMGIGIVLVGVLMGATTGIVGATVVTLGLLTLPTLLRRGYDKRVACGSICASGTLGQIIPPSIVLVILGDQISNAYVDAQRTLGNYSPEPVSVGDLFAGALIPGLLIYYHFGQTALAIAAGIIFGIGLITSHIVTKQTGIKDDPRIVIDEIAGQWVALLGAHFNPLSIACAFLLFRFFDITKIWPAGRIDKQWPGPMGIMFDDVIAGVYAAQIVMVLHLVGFG